VKLDNPLLVQWEYASEERLAQRNAVYHRLLDGANPENVVFDAVVESAPQRFLDAGCGMGELAERVKRELGAEVCAIDFSPRMVELTRARGIDAQVADIQALPFEDASFDCVGAGWVLYHVPELDQAVRELARVLRPGGRLVAGTLGEEKAPRRRAGSRSATRTAPPRSSPTSRASSGATRSERSSSPTGRR
jgi:SAM-dependent methyltransferase